MGEYDCQLTRCITINDKMTERNARLVRPYDHMIVHIIMYGQDKLLYYTDMFTDVCSI